VPVAPVRHACGCLLFIIARPRSGPAGQEAGRLSAVLAKGRLVHRGDGGAVRPGPHQEPPNEV